MRVLLANKFFRRGAGAETVFFDTMTLLEADGHTVVPFAMQHEDNEPSVWSTYFVRRRDYVHGGGLSRARDAAASVYSLEARKKLRELLRVARPDVAHLHNVYHQLTLSILDELCTARVPVVMTLHDYKPVCPNYQLLAHDGVCMRCVTGSCANAVIHKCIKGSRAASAIAAVEATLSRARRQYDKVDRLISPSAFLRDVLVRGGFDARRIDVVPNPVGVSEFEAVRADGFPTFLYFGRLAPEKGLEALLDAASLASHEDLRLLLYGTGPLEEALRKRVQRERLPVELRGLATKAELTDALRRARAAVLPAVWYENCPVSVLEAAAAGVPVIASNIGGIRELVRDRETGLLVEPGSAPELAAAINLLARNVTFARALGTNARAFVGRRHSPVAYLEALLAVYAAADEAASSPKRVPVS